MNFVSQVKRTHYCGALSAASAGQDVVLMGWVDSRRDHGGLVFLDIRDRTGTVQIVLDPQNEEMKTSKDARSEYVVALKGKARLRPEGSKNTKIASGEIEVEVSHFKILSEAKPLPLSFHDENVSEMTRLKYRYLDLRSVRLQKHLVARHEVCQMVRNILSEEKFIEVETPILYKSTPEGARDYLVPSRVSPGKFFALPQSPQILKQLLMISGMDRYFQIARCFRDEDLRADRQPEFTQIDIEMSFVDVDDVLSVNEKLLRAIWQKVKGVKVGEIPRMTFKVAMDRYGSDKPDVRFGMEIQDLTEVVAGTSFKVFEDILQKPEGVIRGICVKGGASVSRSQIDKLTELAKKWKAKGLIWIKGEVDGSLNSPISKFVETNKLQEIFKKAGAQLEHLGRRHEVVENRPLRHVAHVLAHRAGAVRAAAHDLDGA